MQSSYRYPAAATGTMLIGIGILLFTGWWWPGIMVVIGLFAWRMIGPIVLIALGLGYLARTQRQ